MSEPLVCILVPVYNDAPYLEECLNSILAQSYGNWQAIVVNNCSNDGSGEIADRFSQLDGRLRVEHGAEFLCQQENYNRAVSLAPRESRFIKFVEADNWILPDCVSRMVHAASLDGKVGIVGAYYMRGTKLMGEGIPFNQPRVSGLEICRRHLLEGTYCFGNPTTLLLRAEALWEQQPFFQPGLFCDDVDLCYRILRNWDFAFVHQVEMFVRTDNQGVMSFYSTLGYGAARQRLLLERYGQCFLTPLELQSALVEAEQAYLRQLGRACVSRKGREYWEFHREVFELMGRKLQRKRLIVSAARALLDMMLNPKESLDKLALRLRMTRRKRAVRHQTT